MSHRYTLADFPDLIRREGGMVDLFMKTTMSAADVPDEICAEVAEINRLRLRMQECMGRVAEICGYDEDEEG